MMDTTEKKKLSIDNFLGVDFTSSPLKASHQRATLGVNFISDYGSLKKRSGWKEVYHIKDSSGVGQQINGIYHYKDDSVDLLLVYANMIFYKIDRNAGTKSSLMNTCTYAEASLVTSNLTNTRVQFFPDRDKVYIVGCGDYLVFGKYGASYELRRVANNEDTFVPTAVISIDPLEEGGSSAVLDRPNLLSNRMRFNMRGSRYNQFTNVKAVAGSNIDVSTPIASLNGYNMVHGDYVALIEQTVVSQNGIYKFGDEINVWDQSDESTYDAETDPTKKHEVAIDRIFGTAVCGAIPSIEEFETQMGTAEDYTRGHIYKARLTINGVNPCTDTVTNSWEAYESTIAGENDYLNTDVDDKEVLLYEDAIPNAALYDAPYRLKKPNTPKAWASVGALTPKTTINHLLSGAGNLSFVKVTEAIYNASLSKKQTNRFLGIATKIWANANSTDYANRSYGGTINQFQNNIGFESAQWTEVDQATYDAANQKYVQVTTSSVAFHNFAIATKQEYEAAHYTAQTSSSYDTGTCYTQAQVDAWSEGQKIYYAQQVFTKPAASRVYVVQFSAAGGGCATTYLYYKTVTTYVCPATNPLTTPRVITGLDNYKPVEQYPDGTGMKLLAQTQDGKPCHTKYFRADISMGFSCPASLPYANQALIPGATSELGNTVYRFAIYSGATSNDMGTLCGYRYLKIGYSYSCPASLASHGLSTSSYILGDVVRIAAYAGTINDSVALCFYEYYQLETTYPTCPVDTDVSSSIPDPLTYDYGDVIKIVVFRAGGAEICQTKYYQITHTTYTYYNLKETVVTGDVYYLYMKVNQTTQSLNKQPIQDVYSVVNHVDYTGKVVVNTGSNLWEIMEANIMGNRYELNTGYNGTSSYRAKVTIDNYVDGEIVTTTLLSKDIVSGTTTSELYLENETSKIPANIKGTLKHVRDGIFSIYITVKAKPVIAHEDNIILELTVLDTSKEQSIIKNNIGIIFGADGNSNQLFLAGNPTMKNRDYYSAAYDFTYFADDAYNDLGGSSNSIIAYSRLGDSTLVVFKQETSQEASVYFRTETIYADPNQLKVTYQFRNRAGAMGMGAISPYANADLAGDTLFLSKDSVNAVVLSENVATDNRYARERSRYVNLKLRKHTNLKEAVAMVYDSRYYLAIDDVCYIADSRYKSFTEGDMTDTFQYEWYYFENMPVHTWVVIDGQLGFGSKDGMIAVFDDNYTDRTILTATDGDAIVDIIDNLVVHNQAIDIKVNDEIMFTNAPHEVLVSGADSIVIDNYVQIPKNNTIENGDIVYIQLENGTDYPLPLIVSDYMALDTYDQFRVTYNGSVVTILSGIRVSRSINHQKMYVQRVIENANAFLVKRSIDSQAIIFGAFGDSVSTNVNFIITLHHPVAMIWHSALMDLGTSMYSKTLLQLSLSSKSMVKDAIEFGYEITKNLEALRDGSITENYQQSLYFNEQTALNFNDMNFDMFTFGGSGASSFTKRLKVRNFNFITFRILSTSPIECSINDLSAVYMVNRMNRGVR